MIINQIDLNLRIIKIEIDIINKTFILSLETYNIYDNIDFNNIYIKDLIEINCKYVKFEIYNNNDKIIYKIFYDYNSINIKQFNDNFTINIRSNNIDIPVFLNEIISTSLTDKIYTRTKEISINGLNFFDNHIYPKYKNFENILDITILNENDIEKYNLDSYECLFIYNPKELKIKIPDIFKMEKHQKTFSIYIKKDNNIMFSIDYNNVISNNDNITKYYKEDFNG